MTQTSGAATLRCAGLRKRYDGQSSYALGDESAGVSLEVSKGELFALLGPSGCGKTTTLRIVGGFLHPDSGVVEIEGEDVTTSPPYKRRTNTVFQNYALFPHMRLGGNVEFGLKMERLERGERRRRVREALELVGLGGMAERKVTELSGGQQQRAALARAIVKRPAILLLDEPLGALDLKLRRQMQEELLRRKLSTSTTFIHVTHDQEEACAVADRIAVMAEGHIVQVDTPIRLYRSPRTTYVAAFIGAGTILRGHSRRQGSHVEVEGEDFRVRGLAPLQLPHNAKIAAVLPHDRAQLRPLTDGQADPDSAGAPGRIERVTFTGSVFDVVVRLHSGLEARAALNLDQLPERVREQIVPEADVLISWRPEDVVFVEDADHQIAEPAEAAA